MPYKIMKSLISQGSKTKEELLRKVNVYYGAEQLTDEQYSEIVSLINKSEKK